MDKIERLNNLKIQAMSLSKSVLYFLKSIEPLNDFAFMNQKEKDMYNQYRSLIRKIDQDYLDIYRTLSDDERSKHDYVNILGEYGKSIKAIKSIEMVYDGDDEFELNDKFRKAYDFGIRALEEKVAAEKRNDYEAVLHSNRVLAACHQVFNAHFWGKGYQEDLDQYEIRVRSNRTVADDLKDYQKLHEEVVNMSIEYAKAIIFGASEEELNNYWNSYEFYFTKEEELLKFLPYEARKNLDDNFHWLRLEARDNPKEFLKRNGIMTIIK